MNKKKFNNPPHISKVLVEYLDELLPAKDYKPEDSKDDIMFYSGKRDLVNLLRHLHEEQKGQS